MAKEDSGVVIIGAGHAGGTAAATLRQFKYDGPITLVGDEPAPPYQRPPLSKAYFKGEMPEERLYLRPAEFYAAQNIDLRLSTQATTIDASEKRVRLSGGSTLTYDKLIVATGSRPRLLTVPGADLANVRVLRTLEDVDGLIPLARKGAKLAIIGAGYIGLEAAAAARHLGLQVTVIEALDRVLARVTGPEISTFMTQEHERQGADIILNAQVTGFEGVEGRLTGVNIDGRDSVPCDIALIGIGIVPNTEIAEAAGLTCNDGVVVDEDARTSNADIFAIGDCARRPLPHYRAAGRLESVHNALEQAKLAAAAIAGRERPRLDAPWFWSDQYDLKLQMAGLSTGYTQAITRGDPATRKFAVWYLRGGEFLAVDAINSPPDFLIGKKLVGTGVVLDPIKLADPDCDLKEIAANAQA